MTLELTLTEDQLHDLTKALHATRKNSNTVKVDKCALFNLMVDFGTALDRQPDPWRHAEPVAV